MVVGIVLFGGLTFCFRKIPLFQVFINFGFVFWKIFVNFLKLIPSLLCFLCHNMSRDRNGNKNKHKRVEKEGDPVFQKVFR